MLIKEQIVKTWDPDIDCSIEQFCTDYINKGWICWQVTPLKYGKQLIIFVQY